MADPIVEEVRKLREEYASRLNDDLEAIFNDLKRIERKRALTVLRLRPKRVAKPVAPAHQ